MGYIEIFREMISGFRTDVEKYIDGEKSDYLYNPKRTEENGITDSNYLNRQRLLYGLLYNVCRIDEPEREAIIRELFETEIKSRQEESFQGIGENLEMLTYLMRKYRREEDKKLFETAKNANFDCYCGYEQNDPDAYSNYYEKNIKEYPIERCIDIAGELKLKDYACRLVDIYKAGMTDDDKFYSFKRYSEYTGRKEDLIFAVKGRFERALKNKADDFEMMCAYSGYIDFMIEDGDFEGAYSLLNEGRQYFSEYGRSAWQAGVRLMEALPDRAPEIWDFILPHIRTDLKNDMIAPVEAERVMRCADMMGAHKIAKAVKASYDKTMAEIGEMKSQKKKS